MSGQVKIRIESPPTEKMKCYLFSAPSFESKVDDISIGGYKYIGGDHNPQGDSLIFDEYEYDAKEKSYLVNISYPSSALCIVFNAQKQIPIGECFEKRIYWTILSSIILFMMI